MTVEPPSESTTPQHSARTHDLARIEKVVAEVEATQRDRDPQGFMRLLAREAVWVTAIGKRLTGWEEISAFTHKVLTPALGEHYASYEIAHVTFLSDTVAAVNVVQKPIDGKGKPDRNEPEGRPLYVMSKVDGNWLIAVGQNTRFQANAVEAQSRAVEVLE
ncbi:SgcJ/EcaC family oxidoreductase [uncultured Nitratireductor sp.]|uniref:SgcJ/EcaC family oxidoreductase n=1 Tax=uncultured Nitratireductor sp. TaxID=520953 RepID=UPI0025E34341|nr:SgcJ/EcaC family oxidoreductase [uncultured Nitratireductor sp.]